MASAGGSAQAVQVLLDANAKVDDKNIINETALAVASNYGHTEVVELLLKSGGRYLIAHTRIPQRRTSITGRIDTTHKKNPTTKRSKGETR